MFQTHSSPIAQCEHLTSRLELRATESFLRERYVILRVQRDSRGHAVTDIIQVPMLPKRFWFKATCYVLICQCFLGLYPVTRLQSCIYDTLLSCRPLYSEGGVVIHDDNENRILDQVLRETLISAAVSEAYGILSFVHHRGLREDGVRSEVKFPSSETYTALRVSMEDCVTDFLACGLLTL